MNVVLEANLQWLRMSKASTDYGWPGPSFNPQRAYIQEALNLAVAAGVNFASSDSFIVMANPDTPAFTSGPAFTPTGPSFGVTASGKTFQNGATSGNDLFTWGYKWFNHEIGHAMSLVDLYAFAGATHRFVGDYSMMGYINGTAPEILAWERWHLGWLDDSQVVCPASGTNTFALTPVETSGGVKMIVVPTGRTTAVVVESRRPLGFDVNLTRSGLLVYYIDTSIASGQGVVKVLPIDETDTRKLNAPLTVGQSLTYNGVTVKFASGDATTVNVEVTRP
jgi:M6 family metalloprotease-like protein